MLERSAPAAPLSSKRPTSHRLSRTPSRPIGSPCSNCVSTRKPSRPKERSPTFAIGPRRRAISDQPIQPAALVGGCCAAFFTRPRLGQRLYGFLH